MKRALLVIDVQNEYFTGKLPVTYPPGSLDNILTAVKYAREADIPIVLIQHTSPQKDAKTFRKGTDEDGTCTRQLPPRDMTTWLRRICPAVLRVPAWTPGCGKGT